MYSEQQAMTALLIASTALAGFTVVFMGQIGLARSEQTDKGRWERWKDIIILLFSVALSLAVVISAIAWFLGGPDLFLAISTYSFAAQVAAFQVPFFDFWLKRVWSH